MTRAAHSQAGYAVRFDWGESGALAVVPGADVAVVVDVLSFTTTLSVAADAGTDVLPYPLADSSAAAFAEAHGAALAVPRSQARPGDLSLSPASLRNRPLPPRLVLPSPNGSHLSYHLAGVGIPVLGVCLRNASAAASWIRARPWLRTVAVVAAGERWEDGSLRFAVEDLWGAGALVAALGGGGRSPEAHVAALAATAVRGQELALLTACASGRELVEDGWPGEAAVAAEVDSSFVVPVLRGDRYVPEPTG